MARLLLVVFVGSLIVAALLLLALILGDGELGDTAEIFLLVATVTASSSVIAMAGEGAVRFPGARVLGVVTLVVVATAYVLLLRWILGDDRPSRDVRDVTWTAVALSVAFGLTCALVFIPLLDAWRGVRAVTLFFLAGTCFGFLAELWRLEVFSSRRHLERMTAVCGVLFLVGSVIVLVGRDQSRKRMIKEEGGVRVPRCPHCGEELPKELADVFH